MSDEFLADRITIGWDGGSLTYWPVFTGGLQGPWTPSQIQVSDGRVLLVIDPEDRERVLSLMNGFWSEGGRIKPSARYGADAMQAALRSLIEPTKLKEPTGLGAVIEDADGYRWVRSWPSYVAAWSGSHTTGALRYDQIDAVKVISEGVS